jgi:16S rRNA (cytosine1402-N4)-methyltransferase
MPPWAAVGTPSGSGGGQSDGRLLGLDADPAAIARVEARLRARFGDRLVLRQANFRDLASVAPAAGFAAVDGCLSTSACRATSWPIASAGFGFRAGGPLDMRFDPRRGVPAAELLATLDTGGADRPVPALRRGAKGPRIARAIVDARRSRRSRRPDELAALVERVRATQSAQPLRTHPATRVFQALRIAANEELESLEAGLQPPSTSCDPAVASSS